MNSERIRIELSRSDDEWHARVSEIEPPLDLLGAQYTGSGPADVLEALGQDLDEREIARIRRERGI
jgi:hypothetical protein